MSYPQPKLKARNQRLPLKEIILKCNSDYNVNE